MGDGWVVTAEMAEAVSSALVGYGTYWDSGAQAAVVVVKALMETDPARFRQLVVALGGE